MGSPTKKGIGILLVRGLIGGAIGGLIMMAILVNPATVGNTWYLWLLIAYSAFGLPFGLFTGGITGFAIWLIHHKTNARLAPVTRAGVGILISLTFWGLVFLIAGQTDYERAPWPRYVAAVCLFGTTTGLVTGLIVGSPICSEDNSMANRDGEIQKN